ncbi:serine/threonine protein kinase [Paenibacillus sp. YYML68]|uniref:serine/threonine protein kinase n=1 Tax=Paenibacillus sp. YYML68 TaxID=2909250 RepID=UPI00249289AF|nr:serine/threonine protein kinase [Paenibacillus sp. YYML68]
MQPGQEDGPDRLAACLQQIEEHLLVGLEMASESEHDPIQVYTVPEPWTIVGVGNYAAVFVHPSWPEWVVKVYAPGRPGVEEEQEVYRRLGNHPAYSQCLHDGERYLLLRRLTGVTLYNCIRRGIDIPQQVIDDIDAALAYARSKGLNPHDVHGKNVMLQDGRGLVVDVSDFLKEEPCEMWDDLKRAYERLYVPFLRKARVPDWLLNAVRKGYRLLRRWRS